MSLSGLALRIVCSFFVLLLLTRLMGRKEIGQLTLFNYISGIAIGDIAAIVTVDKNVSIKEGMLALSGWALLTIAMGVINVKSKKARQVINGQPRIVVKEGQIMEDELRKARLDINTLLAILRQKDVFSIEDVEYAILEIDGKLSVMKKEKKEMLTKGSKNTEQVKAVLFPIPTEVISDGKINKDNLLKLHLDEKWLEEQLKRAGIHSTLEVFYAELQKDGTLYIDKRKDHLHR